MLPIVLADPLTRDLRARALRSQQRYNLARDTCRSLLECASVRTKSPLRLGAGGMGEVYRARDGRLHRDVAIKVLPASTASDPDAIARLQREARTIAALSHPNILAIFDVGTDASMSYVVTEEACRCDCTGLKKSTTIHCIPCVTE